MSSINRITAPNRTKVSPLQNPRPLVPCRQVCSTSTAGDTVCRGCKRSESEIRSWIKFDSEQKNLIWKRLGRIYTECIRACVTVLDEERLQRAATQLEARPTDSIEGCAYEVIQLTDSALSDLGLRSTEGNADKSAPELFSEVEETIYLRAIGEYEHTQKRVLKQD